jgi:hypothetical protein
MSEAREVLRQLAEQRTRDGEEGRRWEAYRKLCGPPRWFMLLVVALGIASFVLLLEALTAVGTGPRTLVATGRIALVLYALVWPPLLIYVESRRRRGLKKILALEAPELAAKLKDERIL